MTAIVPNPLKVATALAALTGAGSAADDLFAVWDLSAGAWKSMTRAELATALGASSVNMWFASAYKSANQTVNATTDSTLTADTEVTDVDGIHSSGVFTIPTGGDGVWLFCINTRPYGDATSATLRPAVNGTPIHTARDFTRDTADNQFLSWTIGLRVAAGDTVEWKLNNTGGVGMIVPGNDASAGTAGFNTELWACGPLPGA